MIRRVENRGGEHNPSIVDEDGTGIGEEVRRMYF